MAGRAVLGELYPGGGERKIESEVPDWFAGSRENVFCRYANRVDVTAEQGEAERPVAASSLGRYVFGSEISYNKAPPPLPGLAY